MTQYLTHLGSLTAYTIGPNEVEFHCCVLLFGKITSSRRPDLLSLKTFKEFATASHSTVELNKEKSRNPEEANCGLKSALTLCCQSQSAAVLEGFNYLRLWQNRARATFSQISAPLPIIIFIFGRLQDGGINISLALHKVKPMPGIQEDRMTQNRSVLEFTAIEARSALLAVSSLTTHLRAINVF